MGTGVIDSISNYYNNENYVPEYDIDCQIKLITALEKNLSSNFENNKVNYINFWQKQLEGYTNINLTFLRTNNAHKDRIRNDNPNGIDSVLFWLSRRKQTESDKAKVFDNTYVYGQCILALLLQKYTSQEQFAIAFFIAIKEGPNFTYGTQVNTTFIPYRFDKIRTIADLLLETRDFLKLVKQDSTKPNYYPILELVQGINKHILDVSFLPITLQKSIA